MSLGTDIIQDALKEIGVHSVASPAPAEAINDGMKKLNSMIHLWTSRGIKLGIVPLQAPGEELAEPADCRSAIVFNLAIKLASSFDNGESIVSKDLKDNARSEYIDIRELYGEMTVPKKKPSGTLPMGAGNKPGRWNQTFHGTEATNLDG